MQNFIQPGEHIKFTNSTGSAIGSGVPVKAGNIVAVTLGSVANNASTEARTRGVFELKKKAALAINAGDAVFWDNDPGEVTKTAADGFFIGHAVAGVGSSAANVQVLLVQQSQSGAVADISTANGSDAATTQALANSTKTKVNEILAALRAAGILAV